MKYSIRKMSEEEYSYLDEFLYYAIFNSDKDKPFPKSITTEASLQPYINEFGSLKNDYCLCVETTDLKIIAAIWIRNIKGYGYVDDKIPELTMSVCPEYRGKGIGRKLLQELLIVMKNTNIPKLSLSVQKENYALNLYLSEGFKIYREKDNECIMIYRF